MTHIINSEYLGASFSSGPVSKIFSDESRLQRWLDIEAALAQSQSELGHIPTISAQKIAQYAQLENLDMEKLKEYQLKTGHSLIPLLWCLGDLIGEPHRTFIHFGATTQDIQDTAQSMEIKKVDQLVTERLLILIDNLRLKAHQYQHIVISGRTHTVPSTPITVGLKISSWLDEIMRAMRRINRHQEDVHVVQLFGASGSMAGYGREATTLMQKIARKLELKVPDIAWHACRDRFVEAMMNYSLLASALSRVSNEILVLSRPDIGEFFLNTPEGKLSSSTMPHKKNPESCEHIVCLARMIKGLAHTAYETLDCMHERDFRGVRQEWCILPEISHYMLVAIELMTEVIKQLEIDTKIIDKNINKYAYNLCSEQIMLRISRKIGKEKAYKVLTEYFQRLRTTKKIDHDYSQLAKYFDVEDINPYDYVGSSSEIVEKILERLNSERI